MNEEIDESEFYHQDFTTASEWEIFMARMEEIISQWRSDDMRKELNTTDSDQWDIRTETLTFALTADFCLHFYKRTIEPSDDSESSDDTQKQNNVPIANLYDFELFKENSYEEHSCLSTWYGLQEYIILAPTNNVNIISEDKIKILLSSAYIVSNSTNCSIPIFVQIREKWQNCYLGVFENESVRTNFEMVHLRKGPTQYSYLKGLVDLFETKIMSPCNTEDILVSVQMTYTLTDFGNYVWKQEILDGEFENTESLFILPFGVSVDPISAIFFKATWSRLPDHLIMDSENYSDFNPMAAPKWSCSAKRTYEPVCLLGEVFSEFIHNLGNNSSVYDVLGEFANSPTANSNPLDVLTEPAVPAITALLSRVARHSLSRNRRADPPPINESILVPILYFLFPDADENSKYPYEAKEDKEPMGNPHPKDLEEQFKGFKTAAVDSLCWRLSIVLAHALQSLGGVKAFCHLWYEFVQEMRYRWEKSMPIPGLAPGVPDLRTCLLNQKLQMLNCCIDRKLSREASRQSTYDSAEDSDTDEEFFDCSDAADEEAKKKEKQPVGRLSKFADLKLLRSGDPLYIPVTQEPVPKTEDQLEEDTNVLLQLGSDAEASELRARIMSASLLSDMESFKAANPGSVVEDFIRWYSPRDWIEEDETDEWGQQKGHLSPRMLIEENNLWVQMWEASRPVPACRQKRLFDDTREAEKVLQLLDLQTVSQICDLVIPVLSHAAICRLVAECPPLAEDRIAGLLVQGERLSRDPSFHPRRLEAFGHEITSLELLISQINSLRHKLSPAAASEDGAVGSLAAGNEVVIEGRGESAMGGRIVAMFSEVREAAAIGDTGGVFPAAAQKEFVLRADARRPACHSAKCPQFLRAIVNKDEFRLIGAFSDDIVFF